jgi:RNA-binding protein
MPLTQSQIKHLKALAHHRKPVVTVGTAGLTAAVLREVAAALRAHELIKIKLPAMDRDDRQALFERLCAEAGAEAVQHIGRIAVVYRRADPPLIELPA